ncbi:MAG: SRPBCC family protein [Acidobacteriota bacterium]
MRMRDRPTIEAVTFIDAPPSYVWEMVTDIVRMGQWSPEYQGGEWLDGATRPVVGSRFRGRNRRRDREWESVSTVIEAEPGRSFAWAVGDPENAAATWRFDLTPEGTGTLLRQHVQLGPGPSGLTARIEELRDREEEIVASRSAEHRRNMQSTLEGIKSTAEGEHPH